MSQAIKSLTVLLAAFVTLSGCGKNLDRLRADSDYTVADVERQGFIEGLKFFKISKNREIAIRNIRIETLDNNPYAQSQPQKMRIVGEIQFEDIIGTFQLNSHGNSRFTINESLNLTVVASCREGNSPQEPCKTLGLNIVNFTENATYQNAVKLTRTSSLGSSSVVLYAPQAFREYKNVIRNAQDIANDILDLD